MTVIALFFPAMISLRILMADKTVAKKDFFNSIFAYCMYAIVINLSSMAMVSYVLGIDGLTISVLESFSFFIVYTVMSCFWALFVAIITKLLRRNIHFKPDKAE